MSHRPLAFAAALALLLPMAASAQAPGGEVPEVGPQAPVPAPGQVPDPPLRTAAEVISLGTVLSAAARQNPDLVRAQVDVERANAAALQSLGVDDWVVTANAGLFVERNEAVAGNVLGTNALDLYSFEAALTRGLSTGGTFSVGFTGRRRSQLFTRVVEEVGVESTVIDYNGQLALSLTQPLLRGRGSRVARGLQRQARLTATVQELTAEASVRDLLRQVIQAYWEVAYAHQDLEIRRATLELAEERRRITNAAIEAGTVAPTEALAVEQIITTREEAILTAMLSITERSLELRRLAFLEIGPDALDLGTVAATDAQERPLDEKALIEAAMANSPEIVALERQGEGASIEVEITENGLLPRLDFSLEGGPVGTESRPSDALERLATFKGWNVTANLSYEQRLGNRAARGLASSARANVQRIRIGIAEARRQVALAMAQAIRNAQMGRKRMELGKRTIALAEKNIEAEKARFELGRATNFDVLQRQDELGQAQLRYARAVVDVLRAEAIIDALTGELLPRYGVTVER